MKKITLTLWLYLLVSNPLQAKDIKDLFEAAEEGSKVALYDLGVRYGNGGEVKQDKEVANQYYEKSALLGYAPAQNDLGWSYRQGIAVPKNPVKALYWFPATSFGKAIRERRLIMGMSQEELASSARIERSHVGKLERGEHLPNLLMIFRLAVALDVLPGSLVDRAAELMHQHINKS